jgi:hypothetical protein
LIWLQGGLSTLDSFDPKPGSNRGPFRTHATSEPGVRFAEHLPRLARLLDLFQVVRSFRPGVATHGLAERVLLTGDEYRTGPSPPLLGHQFAPLSWLHNAIPRHVQLGGDLDHSFLTDISQCDLPLIVPGLSSDPGPDLARYGVSDLGRRLLRARQLVERSPRFVTVSSGGWDHHESIADLLPPRLDALDRALSSLLLDLSSSGLLSTTLVLVLSDFGRSPRMNSEGGRGHWPETGLFLRAGGTPAYSGVLGATLVDGSSPSSEPLGPASIFQTVRDHFYPRCPLA